MIRDPYFTDPHTALTVGEFRLAWLASGCAVILRDVWLSTTMATDYYVDTAYLYAFFWGVLFFACFDHRPPHHYNR